MSMHDDRTSIGDMLSHSREAVDLLGRASLRQLEDDRTLQLALTRLIEIIGEAANRVSKTTRDRCQKIPWHEIIGMRNRLIHGYDVIDTEVLWDTITDDLPPLIEKLSEFRD